jgi:3-isopropylmalate/(R)-2-methylmalate dehydratase small subunit
MERFARLDGIAAPLPQPNIDTDVIVRVERCARVARGDLGGWAFEAWRYRPDGTEDPDFVLNRHPWRESRILVCGENFGCGSSREMAVWALAGFGVRCVIAPSFGEIFYGNCFQNGLLPIRLPAGAVAQLMARAAEPATARFTVDLERQLVNETIAFAVEPLRREMLLAGTDEIGLTLGREADIAAFQAADRARRPWIYAI